MVNIKNFIDKVSAMEIKAGRDLVMSSQDARLLRDEIVKLLADKVEAVATKSEVIDIQITGGRW